MSVMLSHHSGPVVVSAASDNHIAHYLAAEKIRFKVCTPMDNNITIGVCKLYLY